MMSESKQRLLQMPLVVAGFFSVSVFFSTLLCCDAVASEWVFVDTNLDRIEFQQTDAFVLDTTVWLKSFLVYLKSTDGIIWNPPSGCDSNWHKSAQTIGVHDSWVYAIGGFEGWAAYASPDGCNWYDDGVLPIWGLTGASAVSFENNLLVLGGDSCNFLDCEEENEEIVVQLGAIMQRVGPEHWEFISLHPCLQRSGHASVAFRDRMWIIGGGRNEGSRFVTLNDVWSSEDGTNWIQVAASAPWCPRAAHRCVVYGDRIWLLAGNGANRAYNDVWTSQDGATWTCVTPDAPWGRRYYPGVVVFQNKLWVIAGTLDWRHSYNDVWYYEDTSAEGEGEGEPAPQRYYHSGDKDTDREISLNELLRVIQFYNSDGLHCEPCTEDDYDPGAGDQGCRHHDSDYAPEDWTIDLSELLRLIQLYNMGGYHPCTDGEDGFCPGAK